MRHNVLSERRRYMLHVHHPFRLVHTRAYENILWTRLCRPRSRVRDADDYVGRYLGTCNCSLVSPRYLLVTASIALTALHYTLVDSSGALGAVVAPPLVNIDDRG